MKSLVTFSILLLFNFNMVVKSQYTISPIAQNSEISPSSRSGYVFSYDSKHQRIFLYGGLDTNNKRLSDTWSWNGKSWTQLKIEGPGARQDAQMAFDSKRVCFVLFGGLSEKSRMGDTWELCRDTWKLVKSDGPPARILGAMTFDTNRGRTVLFGGSGANREKLGDTWEWDGASWIKVSETGPPARSSHGLTYHAGRKTVIMLDGYTDKTVNDMWEWDGKTWHELPPPTMPARLHFALGYDNKYKRLVVFGGFGEEGRLGDTWEWDGTNWQEFKINAPEPRAEHDGVYFAGKGFVIFGGIIGQELEVDKRERISDTWFWDGKHWHKAK